MTRSIEELVASTSELAALPNSTVRLLEVLDDPSAEATKVLEVIGKDPSLTANLLKLCNSAYYGVRRRIGSVREALVLLGNQTVVSLAFATSMGDIIRRPLTSYGLAKRQLWHHALATALGAAYFFSAQGQQRSHERAFTGALMHDIGKLLIDRALCDLGQTLRRGEGAEDLIEVERELLGFDHATVGAALAEAWNFPPDLVDVIRWHHEPAAAQTNGELVRAVAAANLLATHLGFNGGGKAHEIEDLTAELGALGYDVALVNEAVGRVPKDLRDMLSALGEPL